ncbi:hypothetical protein GX586_03355 [bacterium]|nr:hypothetical protein [bacterium]
MTRKDRDDGGAGRRLPGKAFAGRLLVAGCILVLAGCDPLEYMERVAEESVAEKSAPERPAAPGSAAMRPAAQILEVMRGDLIEVAHDGSTAALHLAYICSPSLQSSALNARLDRQFEVPNEHLAVIATNAVRQVRRMTEGRKLELTAYKVTTNGEQRVQIDGDLVFSEGTTLANRLVSAGLALVVEDTPDTPQHLRDAEREAREAERGLWLNTLPLIRRFDVDSAFNVKVLRVDRDRVYQEGPGHEVKESHKVFEKQASISVGIRARKPLTRDYGGRMVYRFVVREEKGERVQEISAAPAQATGSDGKPLTRAQRNQMEKDRKAADDYNRASSGQAVSETSERGEITVPFTLVSRETNMVLLSDVFMYTESIKAGVNYNQGEAYIGYNLEVWVGTNIVYEHKHYR